MALCISPVGEYVQWGWRTGKGPSGGTICAVRREFESWEGSGDGEGEMGGSCRGWREAGLGTPSGVQCDPIRSVFGKETRGNKQPRCPTGVSLHTGHPRGTEQLPSLPLGEIC